MKQTEADKIIENAKEIFEKYSTVAVGWYVTGKFLDSYNWNKVAEEIRNSLVVEDEKTTIIYSDDKKNELTGREAKRLLQFISNEGRTDKEIAKRLRLEHLREDDPDNFFTDEALTELDEHWNWLYKEDS